MLAPQALLLPAGTFRTSPPTPIQFLSDAHSRIPTVATLLHFLDWGTRQAAAPILLCLLLDQGTEFANIKERFWLLPKSQKHSCANSRLHPSKRFDLQLTCLLGSFPTENFHSAHKTSFSGLNGHFLIVNNCSDTMLKQEEKNAKGMFFGV